MSWSWDLVLALGHLGKFTGALGATLTWLSRSFWSRTCPHSSCRSGCKIQPVPTTLRPCCFGFTSELLSCECFLQLSNSQMYSFLVDVLPWDGLQKEHQSCRGMHMGSARFRMRPMPLSSVISLLGSYSARLSHDECQLCCVCAALPVLDVSLQA